MSKPAFPCSIQDGMKLREYYAGLIMASISNANNTPDEVIKNVKFAIEAADFLEIQLARQNRIDEKLQKIYQNKEDGRDETI